MKLRYTKRAASQIAATLDYVATESPQGAVRVRDRLLALVALLQEHPYAGRSTSRPGVRRLVAVPYPYLIDYRLTETEIIVMRFRHTARRQSAPR